MHRPNGYADIVVLLLAEFDSSSLEQLSKANQFPQRASAN